MIINENISILLQIYGHDATDLRSIGNATALLGLDGV
jgi:hypothetical protein